MVAAKIGFTSLTMLLLLIAVGCELRFYPSTEKEDKARLSFEMTRLAPHPAAPQWTSDGSTILFSQLMPRGANPDNEPHETHLYAVRSDGAQLKRLSKEAFWPSLSPNDSEIAYSRPVEDSYLFTFDIEKADIDGSNKLLLAGGVLEEIAPEWSPDGARIAFVRDLIHRDKRPPRRQRGIYLMNADGSDGQWLLRFRDSASGDSYHELLRSGLAWSPDGQTLAFVVQVVLDPQRDARRSRAFRDVVHLVRTDGTGTSRVFAADVPEHRPVSGPNVCLWSLVGEPAWSPDGKRLAFIEHISRPHKWTICPGIEAPPGGPTLYTVAPDGSELRALRQLDGWITSKDWHTGAIGGSPPTGPVWSPDGAIGCYVCSPPQAYT